MTYVREVTETDFYKCMCSYFQFDPICVLFCYYKYFPNELLLRRCGCGLHILLTLLCRPLECGQFDKQYRDLVHRDISYIEKVVSNSASPTENIMESELYAVFLKLKDNKAADIMNLTSEHFKFEKVF